MERLLKQTAQRAIRYLAQIQERAVAPSPEAVAALEALTESMPDQGSDPIGAICERAGAGGAWVHVDAAFGLWAAAVPSLQPIAAGMRGADSWATDAHKLLNVPYDSGIALVRNRSALQNAMAITADYLPTETEGRNPSDYTPELSRRARGVEV